MFSMTSTIVNYKRKNFLSNKNSAYYAGIMPDAFRCLLC